MDHFELLKITEGKNRKKSLVFHIVHHKNEKHYELLIAHVCQNKAYKKLKEFHSGYISQYTAKVTKNKLPLIRKKCLDREKKLKELLQEFHDLTFEDQMSKLEFYCTEFGLYTSDLEASDFGKVPEPSLSEVQEAESASFLSFREILNY